MSINRKEIAPGLWQYIDPEETDFIFFALPDYAIERMDDFLEGRQKAIRRDVHGNRVEGENVVLGEKVTEYLLGIRAEAFAAYKSSNFDLMLAKLGQLEAQCNWRGLAFATKSVVEDDYNFRASQRKKSISTETHSKVGER